MEGALRTRARTPTRLYCISSWMVSYFSRSRCWLILFLFSYFPFRYFSISIWTSFVSSCLFLVGTMLSPRFRFLLRLVEQNMLRISRRTHAGLTFSIFVWGIQFVFVFFPHPIYYLRPSILFLLVVNKIRGHIAGSSAPLPTTVRALHFFREKTSALSSLVDSRRIVLTHARRSQPFILLFIYLFCK